ncbi:MBL fold metallo-hydrolase [Neptuniibacter caesariensis]|uniref:Metallo-beta-lactamase domain-containing protein n=1 Tax=Neptuniibacter caesariensis TaxID=207954 RepID=A0A7U8C6N1_NEPCE|nr:MBL fold metallo-hydrolase [Neptuniibacter caesariensis]EAR62279.1 hypothetical protein MED92_14618 [Oceanospirillum sp. MED92] [Neptuniibacter caesariensis]
MRNLLLTALGAITLSTTALAETDLSLKVYNADGNSFHVTSVLVSGEKESILIDSGFTKADAYRIAANVLDSGTELQKIFISQADPDYFFGAETLKKIFPNAEVVSTPAVIAQIKKKAAGKVAYWGPKMGNNAPVSPIIPQAVKADSLMLEGQAIEIIGTEGPLAHRPYLWIPSEKAILGNVAVFGDLHVWTADTQKSTEQSAWKAQLVEMERLKPTTVIPGHMQADSKTDRSAITTTKAYLEDFYSEAEKAKNAEQLIQVMQSKYPSAKLEIALQIGAKVAKGEMKW